MKRTYSRSLFLFAAVFSLAGFAGAADEPGSDGDCDQVGHRVYAACIDRGHAPEECRELAAAARERCLRAHHPCLTGCGERARRFYQECVDSGHDPDDCEERATALRRHCVEKCQAAPGCVEHCRARARRVVERCLDLGTDPAECREIGPVALDRCLDGCRPCVRACRDHRGLTELTPAEVATDQP